MSARTLGGTRGAGWVGGAAAPRAAAPVRRPPVTLRTPPQALYREYRALKEALGQAGGIGPRSPEQSLPAPAEEVPWPCRPSLAARFLRGRAQRSRDRASVGHSTWGEYWTWWSRARGWGRGMETPPPRTPALLRLGLPLPLLAGAGAQLLGAPLESGCDPESSSSSSFCAKPSGVCAGLRGEA